jgi:hypothetical protein
VAPAIANWKMRQLKEFIESNLEQNLSLPPGARDRHQSISTCRSGDSTTTGLVGEPSPGLKTPQLTHHAYKVE